MLYEEETCESKAILFEDLTVGAVFQVDSSSENKGDYYLNVGLGRNNTGTQYVVKVFNLTDEYLEEINYDSYVIQAVVKHKMVLA